MKLSELVGYLNLLDGIDLDLECRSLMNKFQAVEHTISNHPVQVGEFTSDFSHNLKNISDNISGTQQSINNVKDYVRRSIAELEPGYYQNSRLIYEGEMQQATTYMLLNRRLSIDEASELHLRSRLSIYTDWRVPGIIIGPGLEKFIEHLVPLDPLYLVDQRQELLDPAMQLFPEAYQRRLRPYSINDLDDRDILWQLPSNQFGLIFAYNYFNFKPMEILRRYLDSIYTKLRHGGAVIFTFNDCDLAHGVALAEANFMRYTPGREIRAHANLLGFEIVSEHRGRGNLSWMELKKPGEIESIRGGQTLAKIVAT
jgi:hypothetical protein